MTDRTYALLAVLLITTIGCGKNNDDGSPEPDAAVTADAGTDASTIPDSSSGDDATAADPDVGPDEDGGARDAGEDAGEPDSGQPITIMESEPNDGSTLDEVDDFPIGSPFVGNIDAEDTDVLAAETEPGKLYTVSLAVDRGSNLQPHLTVLDAGRDGDAAGEDYVKIVRGTSIQFLAMGEGGHLVIVRDSRNVDGEAVGGDNFGYVIQIEESDPVPEGAVTFGQELSETLARPGDVHLWSFDGTEGSDVVFDMNAPDGDGRLYVFAAETGSWIARQDDRTAGDPNPLLDAPLTASGPMYLVVENIVEDVPNIDYTIATGN